MHKAFLSLGLVAIFATHAAFAPSVYAQNQIDPMARGCEQGSETLTFESGGNYPLGFLRSMEVKVELRKSQRCKANWVKANVPKDTLIFLKDLNGNRHVERKARVNGWNYSDMMNYETRYRACVRLPNSAEDICTGAPN